MRRRRRFSRNERFELTAPRTAPEPALKPRGISGLTILGIVVNPKTKEPLLACTDGEYVSIRSLKEERLLDRMGLGYHSTGFERAAEVTGYPRVHTPDGVKERGGGYGTALYTALVLGSYQAYDDTVEISMTIKAQGISSAEDDRSTAADRWWDAAVQRGLADREEEQGDPETEEHVDLTRRVSASDLESAAGLEEGEEITYVNDVDVDVSKPGESEIFDYYTWSSASKIHDLVVLASAVTIPELSFDEQLEFIWRSYLDDTALVQYIDTDALLALDVRGLDRNVVSWLELAYLDGGMSIGEADDMVYRYEHKLDPGEVSPQQRLFKNAAHGVGAVQAARQRVAWSGLSDLP